ncbi:ERA-like protein 1 [Desulfosoma caldarium]|uniref:hypothetical protein n=1 Tax=Desulfosoma caldarium TaxID=610254 RepID=UPI0011CEB067|nr:hypothetical protein [Desulfosoma caldarium]
MVLVLKKVDLLKDNVARLPMMESHAGPRSFGAVVPLSALTGDGVPQLLAELEKWLPEGPQYDPNDAVTDQLKRFLVSEIV